MAASYNRIYYQIENGKLFQKAGKNLLERNNIQNKKIIISVSLDIKCYLLDLEKTKEDFSTMLSALLTFAQKFPNAVVDDKTILTDYKPTRELAGHLKLLEKKENDEIFPIIIHSKHINNYKEQYLLAVLQLIDLQQYLNQNNDAVLIIPTKNEDGFILSLKNTLSTPAKTGVTTLLNRVLMNFENFNAGIELELFRKKLMAVTAIERYIKTPYQAENSNVALDIKRSLATGLFAKACHHRHEQEAHNLIHKILEAADEKRLTDVLEAESKRFEKGGYKDCVDAALTSIGAQESSKISMQNS